MLFSLAMLFILFCNTQSLNHELGPVKVFSGGRGPN